MKARLVANILEGARQRGDYAITKTPDGEPATFVIICPGCGNACVLSLRLGLGFDGDKKQTWQWDGNPESPTLKPSINHVGCWHGWLTAGEFTGA